MQNQHPHKKEEKPTAGEMPDHQQEFENTTWQQSEKKDAEATEPERKNVSKTLPDTASKEEDSSSRH